MHGFILVTQWQHIMSAFFCKCESCNYQKEHGHWPMRIGPDCTLPIDACLAELHPKHVMMMP